LAGVVLAIIFTAVLFPGPLSGSASLFGFGFFIHRVEWACADPLLQWFVLAFLFFHLVIFLLVQRRNPGLEPGFGWWNPAIWLGGVATLAAADCVFQEGALDATRALIFLAAMNLGTGAVLWARWAGARDLRGSMAGIIWGLFWLLAAAAWHPARNPAFQYHDDPRWIGVWNNPNLFGLLMGTGLALAAGLMIKSLGGEAQSLKGAGRSQGAEDPAGKSAAGNGRRMMRMGAVGIPGLAAGLLLGRGWWHSYSRGAWVGTVGGLGYLAFQSTRQRLTSRNRESGKGNAELEANSDCGAPPDHQGAEPAFFSAAVILASVLVLAFWQFRQIEWPWARRALSTLRAEDFSWRNRVTAWNGALQITVEHPWLGAGWNQPERLYQHYYLPPGLDDGAAIEMNDYLMLSATLGAPALGCFGMYLWMRLFGKAECRKRKAESGKARNREMEARRQSGSREGGNPGGKISGEMEKEYLAAEWLRITCHAGAIVLLVGFWFDGGLFKPPTAATAWTLLELGGVGARDDSVTRNTTNDGGEEQGPGGRNRGRSLKMIKNSLPLRPVFDSMMKFSKGRDRTLGIKFKHTHA
jgi:hypothetical protein